MGWSGAWTWAWSRMRLGIALGMIAGLTPLVVLDAPARAERAAVVSAGGGPSASAASTRRFHSEPWLHPYPVSVSRDPDTHSGDIFLAPRTGRRGAGGLMILNPRGQLVWFHSVAPDEGNNLEVQTYRNQPVLTWWQGHKNGRNEDVIASSSYKVLAVVHAGRGFQADPHDFRIAPHNRVWLLADHNVRANLTPWGGSSHGVIRDKFIQEVDISTGKVLWQWDAHRHIPLSASYTPPTSRFFDAYHLNSIQLLPGGKLLVSSRSTWSVYEISIRTHRILWTLGGKYSSFAVSPGARFEWQHAAHLAGSKLTVFDDASYPPEEPQSSAKQIRLNFHQRTATLIRAFDHSPPLLSASQGNAQPLPNGNVFVGWGSAPDFSEYTPGGRQIMTGSFPLGVQSYRALRFHWTGHPVKPPSIAASTSPHGRAIVWASWNGATNVAAWRVLGGSSRTTLRPLTRKSVHSFETEIRLASRSPYVDVQALNAQGRVIGTSGVRSLGG